MRRYRYRYRCTVCRTTSPVVHQLHDLAAEGTAHRRPSTPDTSPTTKPSAR